jgi:two-component system KDP operon response regulator KdpE
VEDASRWHPGAGLGGGLTETKRTVVLLIEGEPHTRRSLRRSLMAGGYAVLEAGTGRDGLSSAAANVPDVVLLDPGLPDMDGLEVTRRLRDWSTAPVIVLAAHRRDQDEIATLDAGADDYLTKPFGVGELLARIRVAIRHHASRAERRDESVYEAGELVVDLGNHVVTLGGDRIHLTPTEYRLLATLARNRGRVMTYARLLSEVWGVSDATRRQYLHVYVGWLRKKLERDPARPRFLVNEPGVGYRFKVT